MDAIGDYNCELEQLGFEYEVVGINFLDVECSVDAYPRRYGCRDGCPGRLYFSGVEEHCFHIFAEILLQMR